MHEEIKGRLKGDARGEVSETREDKRRSFV